MTSTECKKDEGTAVICKLIRLVNMPGKTKDISLKFLADPLTLKIKPIRAFGSGISAHAELFDNEQSSLSGYNESLIVTKKSCNASLISQSPADTKIVLHKTREQIDACFDKLGSSIGRVCAIIYNENNCLTDSIFSRLSVYLGLTNPTLCVGERLVG